MTELDTWVRKLGEMKGPDALADFLAEEKVWGYRGSALHCPLANFLGSKVDEFVVAVDGSDITMYDDNAYLITDGGSTDGVAEDYGVPPVIEHLDTPPVLRDFVVQFDMGKYPWLDNSPIGPMLYKK